MKTDCKCKENKDDEIIVDALVLVYDSLLTVLSVLDEINEKLEYRRHLRTKDMEVLL